LALEGVAVGRGIQRETATSGFFTDSDAVWA